MATDSEFMMTAEEIRLKNLKRRRIFLFGVALVLLGVFAFFGARPTAHAVKAWQARRHAAKAFAYIDKEAWADARNEASTAYQLRPSEPQAVRAVARILSRTRQPDALDFWAALEKITSLTREDRREEATIALLVGETAVAETAVRALNDSKQNTPGDWLLVAQLAIQKNLADDAVSALRTVFSDNRATDQQQLQAALLELSLASGSSGHDDWVNEGSAQIQKIAHLKSSAARDALVLLAQRALASSPGSGGADAMTTEEIEAALENHPLSGAPQKLLALDLQEHADPSRRDELLNKGIAEFKNGNANDLVGLATWLNGKGEFQKTIEVIPLEKAVSSRDLYLQHLDALGAIGRWKEVQHLLASGRYPLDQVVEQMYLARADMKVGENAAAQNDWHRALEKAAGDTGNLLTLAEYAEKNGVFDIAQQAFEAAAQQTPKLRLAQQGRLRMAERSHDTNRIHGVLADMLAASPKDAAVQNDEGYTRLLLLSSNREPGAKSMEHGEESGEHAARSNEQRAPSSELQALEQLASKLVEKNPRSLPHRTFLALVRLKQNRAADALVVYENITVPTDAVSPSALAVHAAVLAANGRAEEAHSEARQIKIEQLLPEERALIKSL